MRSFDNLLARYGFITEAKTSPFAGTHPSFGGITKSMATRGMSSAPYDTVKFLATFLYELDIISDDERKMVLKAQGFKGKQLALLEVIKDKSREIVANSARIEEAMPTELENYINRATLNRGRDMMADVKGVEGGSGGRRDKYAAQAAALAAKRKASAEAKMQSKALQAAAQGEEADVQSAVDVLINTLDDADREVVDRADVAAGIGFKGAADVKLNFDDIDINIGATVRDRDTLIDKLVNFFNKQPNYTAEKTRRGVNVEGPTGSFGTNVQDAEDMIVSLIKRARPDVDEAQIVVDLFSDKGVSEDEEYGASKDQETEFHGKLDKLVHNTFGKRKEEAEESSNVYEGEAETVFYGDDGEEVDGVVYYTATKNPRTGEIDIQLTGGDVTGYNPAARVDDDYIDSIISNPRYNQDHIADARRDAEYQFSMSEDEEYGGSYSNYRQGEEPDWLIPNHEVQDSDDDYSDEEVTCSECGKILDSSEYHKEELPEVRLCDKCASIEDEENEEYNSKKADLDNDGETEPWERGIARKRGFKNAPEDEEDCNCEDEEDCNCDEETPYMESYTSLYLEGMTRRSHKQVSAPQTVTFKERMKPKTWKQLAELRNYGM